MSNIIEKILLLFFIAMVPGMSVAQQQKILVIGDSLAQGLGFGLTRCVQQHGIVKIQNEGKTSSRLTYNKPFNWFARSEELAQIGADIVIIQIGANDLMSIRKNGKQIKLGSIEWQSELSARATQIINSFQRNDIPVVWVGLPFPRKKAWQKPYSIINATFMTAATASNVEFIDIWDAFLIDGKYSSYGLGVNGKNTLLRADDGVHFSTQGYVRLQIWFFPRLISSLPKMLWCVSNGFKILYEIYFFTFAIYIGVLRFFPRAFVKARAYAGKTDDR